MAMVEVSNDVLLKIRQESKELSPWFSDLVGIVIVEVLGQILKEPLFTDIRHLGTKDILFEHPLTGKVLRITVDWE